MVITPEEALAVYREADCLHTAAACEAALDRMAEDITAVVGHSNPLFIAIMQGGMVPAGQLLTRLDFPLQVDYLHASRYAGQTSGGELRWIARPATPLKDRVVLLVDDIHDEGSTLKAIVDHCVGEGAARVLSAVLVNKIHDRKVNYQADFVGLEVGDRYVFGYGMDYKDYLRNAPGIYAVSAKYA